MWQPNGKNLRDVTDKWDWVFQFTTSGGKPHVIPPPAQ